MIEQRERLRLALEPREAFGVRRERVRKNRDRDLAPSVVSVAWYTCPIPPSPIGAVMS
jgi:hypothetical protein